MKQRHSLIKLSLLITLSPIAFAQSSPTATQTLQLSAFAGITGTFTGIEGGKNLGVTAGADLTFLNLSRHFKPSIEIRGTYPIDDGHIANEKNFLGGVKVEYPVRKFHPYGDFFVGRGEIDYNNGGFIVIVSPTETLNYLSSNTTIYSPGGGLDYDITHTIALKADVQVQHWDVPVVQSGSTWATSLTFGGVYNFDFNPHRRYKQ